MSDSEVKTSYIVPWFCCVTWIGAPKKGKGNRKISSFFIVEIEI
jgi:hypothetical protein